MAQHLVHSSHPVGQSPYWLFSPPACIPFARLSLHYSRLCTTRVCTPHHRNEETSRPVPTLMNIASAAASLRPDNYQPVSFTPAFVLSTPFPDSSFVSRDIRIRTVPIPILSALLAYQRMRNSRRKSSLSTDRSSLRRSSVSWSSRRSREIDERDVPLIILTVRRVKLSNARMEETFESFFFNNDFLFLSAKGLSYAKTMDIYIGPINSRITFKRASGRFMHNAVDNLFKGDNVGNSA